MTRRPRLALTFGDPAGVGGELAAKLLTSPDMLAGVDVLVIASPEEVERAGYHANVTVDLAAGPGDGRPGDGRPALVDPERAGPLPTDLSEVSADAGRWSLDALRYALTLVDAGRVDGICFTPLNKTSLHLAGMAELDELRWFANQLDFPGVTSELNVLENLWTARVTSHIALADVASKITADAVADTIGMLADTLRDAEIPEPRIGVAALNPHAGENGIFGRQEIDAITPGIERARHSRIDATGPYPSDTVFLKARAGMFDGVVTMYHDQGQIAMKMMGFDKGVTVQGGLPVPIATPAHGSAFDIAGANKASPQATFNAFRLAATMATRKVERSTTENTTQ